MKQIKNILGNMKVRYKLILIYLCVGVLPFITLSMFFYTEVKTLLSEEEYMSSTNHIHQSIQSFDNTLKIYNNLSDYLAFNQMISNTLSYQYTDTYDLYESITSIIDPSINSIKYFHNDIHRITIYTSNNNVKHDTILAPIKEIENQSWFNDISNNSKWLVNKEKQSIFSVRKMPLLDRANVDGVLYIELNSEDLFKYFDSKDFTDYDLFIVDDDNHVLYEKHSNNLKITYNRLLEIKEKDNEHKSIIESVSNETGWKVYLYRSSVTSGKRLQLILSMLLILFIIAGIIACIALIFTSQFIVGRIEKLMNNMKRVENGNMELDTYPEYNDEIGSLINGFKKMVQRIIQLIQEVYVEKLLQKEYEMRALQQQINPHFLYNTLSMINFKALEVGEEDISKITLALSAFYRTSLNKGKNTCTIKDEISNMKAYMDIQLMMHDYNFDFDCIIDDDLSNYETLNLILQPIVENCIKHGLDMIEDNRKAYVKVYITKYEDIIYFMLEDNGVGMDEDTIAIMLSQNSKGYGMRNVNERIKLYYGEEYGLYIESVVGEGTVTTVKIPAKIYKR